MLNVIYPPICGICGKINKNFLCIKCQKQLEKQSKFQVEQKISYYFQEHLYIFEYQGMIRKMLIDYKFQEKSYLYKTIVKFLLKNKKFFQNLESYNTIVPVPISRKRYKERGYNQSELIAKELAMELSKMRKMDSNFEIKYNNNCLFKTKNIIEQSKLNQEERQENIQGVYELCNEKELFEKSILLIDDIYTTGSTVNECSKILSRANPKKIGVLTIAKD